MPDEVTSTSSRKADHLRINLEENVQSTRSTGLDDIQLPHHALPELDLADIELSTTFLGKFLQAPILISSMTGGIGQAGRINQNLAEAAQFHKVALGVGSQRAALEDPAQTQSFQVRKAAPDILLLANLGAVQLNYGYGVEECLRAVEMIAADALILHLNPLQEALQPDGNTNFAGLAKKIEALCHALPVPVIAKEVGWGISAAAAKTLLACGVQVIDIAGAGGTSWSQVEKYRSRSPEKAFTASLFRAWGISTASALTEVRAAFPEVPLIASGGLRHGVDLAKVLALQADLGGFASPMLKAAAISSEAVVSEIDRIMQETRICMFSSACKDVTALKSLALKAAS
ncbi:MAG: type 2 isopentenyl-diphosphate Delta-isomerase [Anaerolineales bacterium]|nr:type 2 isopentenyl-diphosphate Delta-isomerase [Anaerolineales bacterium]